MDNTLLYSEKDQTDFPTISRNTMEILQVNLGYLCKLSYTHCHVTAETKRTELMNKATMDLIPDFINRKTIPTLDLTGGAPEINPYFKSLVIRGWEMAVTEIGRCNLVILDESDYEGLAEFLATNKVEDRMVYNKLFSITNLPIQRFGIMLFSNGLINDYLQLLKDNYRHENLHSIICRNTLSVDWQGYAYDCDFNPILQLPSGVNPADKTHLSDLISIALAQVNTLQTFTETKSLAYKTDSAACCC